MGVNVNPQIVVLFDVNGTAHAVLDGVAIPASTPSLLLAGHDDGAIARVMRTAVDGTVRTDPTGTTVQPVSVAALPLPAGAATEATLLTRATEATLAAFLATFIAEDFATEATLLAGLSAIFTRLGDGSQHTIVDASALPVGAATEATLLTRATEATLLTRASEATLLTRATEATLALIKAKTDNLDVLLSTRASEATLALIKAKTDNLDVLLSTRASEATLLTRATEATLLTRATEATLLTRATEVTLLTRLSKADFEARINTFGQKSMANSTPVVLPSDQIVGVSFGLPSTPATDRLINVAFTASQGALVANAFRRVATYTVPGGFSGFVVKFVSTQDELAFSRVVAEKSLAAFNSGTGVFTDGAAYTSPQFSPYVQAEVTTLITAGPGNIVLTVTYVNENGTAGRTGTITVPRGSVVGSRFSMVFQAGDLGARDITNITVAPAAIAGVMSILGFIQLVYHTDTNSGTLSLETVFAPGAMSFPTGTIIGIEYAGGTVAKSRVFDLMLQLVS